MMGKPGEDRDRAHPNADAASETRIISTQPVGNRRFIIAMTTLPFVFSTLFRDSLAKILYSRD
jgi:hypothetical protein